MINLKLVAKISVISFFVTGTPIAILMYNASDGGDVWQAIKLGFGLGCGVIIWTSGALYLLSLVGDFLERRRW